MVWMLILVFVGGRMYVRKSGLGSSLGAGLVALGLLGFGGSLFYCIVLSEEGGYVQHSLEQKLLVERLLRGEEVPYRQVNILFLRLAAHNEGFPDDVVEKLGHLDSYTVRFNTND